MELEIEYAGKTFGFVNIVTPVINTDSGALLFGHDGARMILVCPACEALIHVQTWHRGVGICVGKCKREFPTRGLGSFISLSSFQLSSWVAHWMEIPNSQVEVKVTW